MDGLDQYDAPPKSARPKTPGEWAKLILQIVGGVGLAVVILGWGLPILTHTTWTEIGSYLSRLPTSTMVWGLFLMFCGLYAYTFTMSASLPGLTHPQALMLNLCGSGVSNVVPAGGAFGAAAQYGILRSWRFNHQSIGTCLIVTSIWNLLIRMVMPLIAIVWLILGSGGVLPPLVINSALIGGIAAAVFSLLLAAMLASPKAAHVIGLSLNAVIRPILRLFRRDHGQDIEVLAMELRERTIHVIRRGWFGLTMGLVGFLGLYGYLYTVCMQAFGIDMSWDKMFACYAFSRLLTMVPLTPGGIGTTEVMPAALMVALGADGAAAGAAVFLFTIYSNLLEIPFGALAWLAYARSRRYYHNRPPKLNRA